MVDDRELKYKRENLETFISEHKRRASTEGVNHIAIFASDLEKTADFYSRVLGMPVISVTSNRDEPQSTHMNVDIGNGVSIAFFDFPHVCRIQTPVEEGIGGMMHIAVNVEEIEYDKISDRLQSDGVTYRRIGNSVYLNDPNGMTIELGIRKA